jgi:hypothetical protein
MTFIFTLLIVKLFFNVNPIIEEEMSCLKTTTQYKLNFLKLRLY